MTTTQSRLIAARNLIVTLLVAAFGSVLLVANAVPVLGAGTADSHITKSVAPVAGVDFDMPAGCTAKPALTDHVAVIPNDYFVTRPLIESFDQASRDAKAGDVWVVGFCR